jgi:hypothetical protein
MHKEIVDHAVWCEENKGNFELSIIARLKGPSVSNVQYMIRLRSPEYETIDYMTTLEGFKEIGELLLALHDFCKLPIYANEKHVEKLRELLTPENIKKFAEIIRSSRLEK